MSTSTATSAPSKVSIYWLNSADQGSVEFYENGQKFAIGNVKQGRIGQSPVLEVEQATADRLIKLAKKSIGLVPTATSASVANETAAKIAALTKQNAELQAAIAAQGSSELAALKADLAKLQAAHDALLEKATAPSN